MKQAKNFQNLSHSQFLSNFQSPKFKFSVSGKKNVRLFGVMTKTSMSPSILLAPLRVHSYLFFVLNFSVPSRGSTKYQMPHNFFAILAYHHLCHRKLPSKSRLFYFHPKKKDVSYDMMWALPLKSGLQIFT